MSKEQEQSIRETNYQANYSSLGSLLDNIPLTYFQRKEIQEYLDNMEEIFRQANFII